MAHLFFSSFKIYCKVNFIIQDRKRGSSLVEQQVKDPALKLQQLERQKKKKQQANLPKKYPMQNSLFKFSYLLRKSQIKTNITFTAHQIHRTKCTKNKHNVNTIHQNTWTLVHIHRESTRMNRLNSWAPNAHHHHHGSATYKAALEKRLRRKPLSSHLKNWLLLLWGLVFAVRQTKPPKIAEHNFLCAS